MTAGGAIRVVLAGGGTGGHVIPAIAVAQEVTRRGGEARFVGTSDRLEARLVPEAGYEIDFIRVKPLAGGGPLKAAAGLLHAPFAVARSRLVLKAIDPHVVMGVGGYVAGPVVLAARLMGLPTALLEQNATVGLTNKILARVVKRAFVTYEATSGDFPAGRALQTGNPVKRSILEASEKAKPAADQFRILVMGGSQGALTIDRRVPEAMRIAGFGGRVTVLHQCGKDRQDEVKEAYGEAGIFARVVDFIDDTASAFLETDLVVARSGATTVSELTVMGLPAVFLPYPHHADRQQEKNAAPMAAKGAAVVLDEKQTDAADLAAAMKSLVDDPERVRLAGEASRSLGRPDAAVAIVDSLEDLVGGSG